MYHQLMITYIRTYLYCSDNNHKVNLHFEQEISNHCILQSNVLYVGTGILIDFFFNFRQLFKYYHGK